MNLLISISAKHTPCSLMHRGSRGSHMSDPHLESATACMFQRCHLKCVTSGWWHMMMKIIARYWDWAELWT